ncbi:MAG: hypothetical protein AAB410_03270 [Patescibacteria group bacterium]
MAKEHILGEKLFNNKSNKLKYQKVKAHNRLMIIHTAFRLETLGSIADPNATIPTSAIISASLINCSLVSLHIFLL